LYFKKDDKRAVRVTVKTGKVSLAFSGGGGREMTALSESRFRLANGPGELTFADVAGGPAQRLSVHFPGAKKPDVYERVGEFQPTANELALLRVRMSDRRSTPSIESWWKTLASS
jgi:hypothetical protein